MNAELNVEPMRRTMTTLPESSIVVLSPHRDDAAFSAGALLQRAATAGLSVTILNLFTSSAYAPFADPTLTPEAITQLRQSEDNAVVALLSSPCIRLHDLALLDAPLRLHVADTEVTSGPLSREAFADQVRWTRGKLPDLSQADMLLGPLALGSHVDHLITRDASLVAVPPDRIGFYQDLPYASRVHSQRELARETTAILASLGRTLRTTLDPYLLRTPADSRKRELVACYGSQVAPETMEEIGAWTDVLGGEHLYLSQQAAMRLRELLPPASLIAVDQIAATRA